MLLKLINIAADELEEFALEHTKEILNGGGEEFNDGPPCLTNIN
jgi:hypothetical protein